MEEIDRRASVLVNEVKSAGRNGVRHDCDEDDGMLDTVSDRPTR